MPANAAEIAATMPSEPNAQSLSQQFAVGVSEGSAAYETIVNSPSFHYAAAPTKVILLKESLIRTPEAEISALWTSGKCHYGGRADYPHVTKGEASVHGYWVVDSGKCPLTAKVEVTLQAYGCASGVGCGWINQNSASGTFGPGSGTGNWATPHKACLTIGKIGWRGRVDVDLSGQVDPLGYDYSAEKDLKCTPKI